MKARGQATDTILLLLGGDVMTGRGIDQVMRQPLPQVCTSPGCTTRASTCAWPSA